MLHGRRLAGAGFLLSSALFLTGCDDPKARISTLEEENRMLNMELDRLRNDTGVSRSELDACRGNLIAAQSEVDLLRGQIANTPPRTDLPGDWQAVPGGAMVAIEGSVLFPAGRTTIRKDSMQLLNQLASEITSNFPDKDIYVFGHTDSDPIRKSGWKDNRELSTQRALAVVRQLQTSGISGGHLVACGWGEHRPLVENSTKTAKAKNRRVEIFAVDPKLASR